MTVTLKPNSKEAMNELQRQTEELLAPLGYSVVALEVSSGGGRKLTLFIDFLENPGENKRIGLNDCMAANSAVDELFESSPLLDGNFTLEVSSPGVERPLRKPEDFKRFSGKLAKLHTFRPLEGQELENPEYWEKNKKQKKFSGRIEGVSPDGQKIQINIDGRSVKIPLELVSKAHLEVDLEALAKKD